jgi:UDPglucose 6-dehydrogenase
MRIAVIGAGYVGLVSAACLADFGHSVICVDKENSKIADLKQGNMPIYEPGLSELVIRNSDQDRLSFTTDLAAAVKGAEAIFIAVGTPSRRGDGLADLTYVYQAAREIACNINTFTVIITKSTVPVGTADEIGRIIRDRKPNADFAVVSNPEFLREGVAISDFKKPDRIIIGSTDTRATAVMQSIYDPKFVNHAPMVVTSPRSAELTKYAANAFLATKIAFINEIADLCENVGADVEEIARGMGFDDRIGPKFLKAGPGYGGSCFPKDTLALMQMAQTYQSPLRIVEAVSYVNEQRKRAMGRKVIAACGGSVRNRSIAILGLTFKPDTDDMREAPSLAIIQTLQDAGARIRVFDPVGMENAKPLLSDVTYTNDPLDCAKGAHALVIVTEWDEFRTLDLGRLHGVMENPLIVDLRNILERGEVQNSGFVYESVGQCDQPVELTVQVGAVRAA